MADEMVNGNGKAVALWAGLTTLFTSFASINLLGLVGGDEAEPVWQVVAAMVTAIMAAAAVYTKVRLDHAKALKEKQNRRQVPK